MANIKEIDLDKNIIISLPDGVNKSEFMKATALAYGWTPTTKVEKEKTFNGTFSEWHAFIDENEATEISSNVTPDTVETDNVEIVYTVIEEVPSAMTQEQFGLYQYQKPMKVPAMRTLEYMNTIPVKDVIEQAEQTAEQAKAQVKATVEAYFDAFKNTTIE